MNNDRRTKAQILAELESSNKTIADLQSRVVLPPQPVPAAQACIRALDAIPTKRGSNLYGNLDGGSPDQGEIANVLRHLIARYGIDLTERVVEPCVRLHLEDVPDEVLIDKLRGRF